MRPVNQKGQQKSPQKSRFSQDKTDLTFSDKIQNMLDSKMNGDKLLNDKLKAIEILQTKLVLSPSSELSKNIINEVKQ